MGPRPSKHNAPAIERATRVMFTRIMSELARTMRDEELTVAQIAALYTIDERGPMRITALAEWLDLSASTSSRMCDALTQRDLLSRTEDPDDRRARTLALTAAGKALVERTSERRMKAIFDLADELPSAIPRTVLELVAHIGAALDKNRRSK